MFLRTKSKGDSTYWQLVFGYRDSATGKPKQRVIKYYGAVRPSDEQCRQDLIKDLQVILSSKPSFEYPTECKAKLIEVLGISESSGEQLQDLSDKDLNNFLYSICDPEGFMWKHEGKKGKALLKVGITKKKEQLPAEDIAPEEDEEEKEIRIPIDSSVFDKWDKLVSCDLLLNNKARGIIEFENKLYVATSSVSGSNCIAEINIEEVIPAENYHKRTHTYNQIPLVNLHSERFYYGVKFKVGKNNYVFVPGGSHITLIRGKPDVSIKGEKEQLPIEDIIPDDHDPDEIEDSCIFYEYSRCCYDNKLKNKLGVCIHCKELIVGEDGFFKCTMQAAVPKIKVPRDIIENYERGTGLKGIVALAQYFKQKGWILHCSVSDTNWKSALEDITEISVLEKFLAEINTSTGKKQIQVRINKLQKEVGITKRELLQEDPNLCKYPLACTNTSKCYFPNCKHRGQHYRKVRARCTCPKTRLTAPCMPDILDQHVGIPKNNKKDFIYVQTSISTGSGYGWEPLKLDPDEIEGITFRTIGNCLKSFFWVDLNNEHKTSYPIQKNNFQSLLNKGYKIKSLFVDEETETQAQIILKKMGIILYYNPEKTKYEVIQKEA